MEKVTQTPTTDQQNQTTKPKQRFQICARELEGKLRKEVESDERYQLVNEAKLRALNQGTSTYDQFRQIWMGAHLKPLDKKDKLDGFMYGPDSKVRWNPLATFANDVVVRKPNCDKSTANLRACLDLNILTNCEIRKRLKIFENYEDKFEFLRKLVACQEDGLSRLETLWKEEVCSDLLSEVIKMFDYMLRDDKPSRCPTAPDSHTFIADMFKIIQLIHNSRRVAITLSFLEKSDKDALLRVLETLGKLSNEIKESYRAITDDLTDRDQGAMEKASAEYSSLIEKLKQKLV